MAPRTSAAVIDRWMVKAAQQQQAAASARIAAGSSAPCTAAVAAGTPERCCRSSAEPERWRAMSRGALLHEMASRGISLHRRGNAVTLRANRRQERGAEVGWHGCEAFLAFLKERAQADRLREWVLCDEVFYPGDGLVKAALAYRVHTATACEIYVERCPACGSAHRYAEGEVWLDWWYGDSAIGQHCRAPDGRLAGDMMVLRICGGWTQPGAFAESNDENDQEIETGEDARAA